MNKSKELCAFIEASEELINGKYILADVKVAGLLKTIAQSETLLALFENALMGFDYEQAKTRYYIKSSFSADKKEFVLPQTSKLILAFVLNVLMDVDSKKIVFGEYLNKYFFEDGSFSAGYQNFVQKMIKPFVEQVKTLMNGIIDGKLQDPKEALVEEEQKRERAFIDEQERIKKEEELSKKSYGESLKALKELLIDDKARIKQSKLSQQEINSLNLIVDTFANALDIADKEAITYAFVSYGYASKVHRSVLGKKEKKVEILVKEIINGL
ncbi:MAG: hypothetical protein II988_04665 [Clostridia bacterium]|nr:hypothetical protein [Clostridia bacterium]